jgi:hypothetical protein
MSRKVDESHGIFGSSITPSSVSEGREPETLGLEVSALSVARIGQSVDACREVQTSPQGLSMTQIMTFLNEHTRTRDEEFRKLTDVVAALQNSTHKETRTRDEEFRKLTDVVAARDEESRKLTDVVAARGEEFRKLSDVVAALKNSTHKEIMVLQKDRDFMVLDVALIMASQLVSRVLGHTGPHRATCDCLIAIKNQNNAMHWGRNFVTMMEKFETDISNQRKLASDWDRLLDERNLAAHPDLKDADNYNEEKAL